MKKYFLILTIAILSGCSAINEISAPSKQIRNEKCEDLYSFKIFQVVENFSLATSCRPEDDLICFGHTVYIPKEKGKVYFDDQKIKIPSNKCVVYSGTYTYEATDGRERTVPKIKFIDANIPNPEYIDWLKSQNNK